MSEFFSNSQATAIIDGVEVTIADMPLGERTGAPGGTCWTITPNPSVMHQGDTWKFTICCEDLQCVPAGAYYFVGRNGIIGDQVPVIGKSGDNCVSFKVTVPAGATFIRIWAVCINFVIVRCLGYINFPCQQREV